MPKHFFIFAGPNGSGKSSVINMLKRGAPSSRIGNYFDNFDSIPYVNADYCTRTDPKISSMPDGKEKDLAAWNRTNEWREQVLLEGKTCIWETVFSHPSRLDVINYAKSLGYFVVVVFITTISPDINVERVAIRVQNNGHGVPEEKIRSRYVRTVQLLPEILELADEVYVYDNSGGFPLLTFGKIDAEFFAYNTDILNDDVSSWVSKHVVVPISTKGRNVTLLDELHTLIKINRLHDYNPDKIE